MLVHTGQHYDAAMSEIFFEQLGVGEPDHRLDVGSGTHAAQTARVMERLEPVLLAERPDVVLVPGDVNSTLRRARSSRSSSACPSPTSRPACARSIARCPRRSTASLTDAVSQMLFIHSPEAREHLLAEGRREDAIHYVGNTMIDTLVAMRARIDALDAPARHGVAGGGYLLVTLHRPALVDGPLLAAAAAALRAVAAEMPVVFPVHPRTRARLELEDPSLADARA